MSAVLVSLLVEVDDLHRPQGQHHSLEAILLIATLTVICGANNWTEVEHFGRQKQTWLETLLDLPHGILLAWHLRARLRRTQTDPCPRNQSGFRGMPRRPMHQILKSETAATLCKCGLVSEAEFGKHAS